MRQNTCKMDMAAVVIVASAVLSCVAHGAGLDLQRDMDASAQRIEWNSPETLAAWAKRGNQIVSASVKDGALRVVCGGGDAQVYSGKFCLASSASQEVVFRAKGNRSGVGEIFWIEPGKSAVQKQSVRFEWNGDGEWHEYRVRPFWQGQRRIGQLRIDFPVSAAEGGEFAISSIAIDDPPHPVAIQAADYGGLLLGVRAESPGKGEFSWASSSKSGFTTKTFRHPGDGRLHFIYLDLSSHQNWDGVVSWTNLVLGAARVDSAAFVRDEPELPPDFVVKSARAEDAFNRVGERTPVRVLIHNLGTAPARHVSVSAGPLPPGVRLVNAAELADIGEVPGLSDRSFAAVFEADSPCEFTARLSLKAEGVTPIPVSASVKILPSLGLPKASYVPEPKPVETDYDIAALYFPGWQRATAWQRVWNVCPERKPVLGWYDEANPEVVDWQIKWLVENGIRTLYVDWYWDRGRQYLDHWVKAFYKARYRRHLKWAMMWANHNAKGSHSVEDQRAVVKFWIENYFNTPEYLRIDDKPVVWIWAPSGMDRDVGPGGCRKLLELSRQMAREAGYKGIYFIAMKWPEADWSENAVQACKDRGFDMTGIYHFMDHGGKAASNRRYSYDLCVEASLPAWRRRHSSGILPFLPNLSTGWDDRPWNDHCEIYGKSVDGFRRICRDAKAFADETGVKRLCIAPLNEWGEGSYAEPNAEFGFGFYEAVRDTFCKKPADGWPANYGPKDVGLGPYDLPPPENATCVTSWDFTKGGVQGWRAMMGLSDITTSSHGLTSSTMTGDPAFCVSFVPVLAREFGEVVVRMKVEGGVPAGKCQLFWAGPGRKESEHASVSLPVVTDGAFHDYRFPVGPKRAWRGRINYFRFDPTQVPGLRVTIESVKMMPISGIN